MPALGLLMHSHGEGEALEVAQCWVDQIRQRLLLVALVARFGSGITVLAWKDWCTDMAHT